MSGMRKWRRHTIEFKRQVVEKMKTCENIMGLARELGLERKLLYTWKYQFEGRPEPRQANLAMSAEERREQQLRAEISKLKSALAERELEKDFFEAALLRIRGVRQGSESSGVTASTRSSNRRRKSKAS